MTVERQWRLATNKHITSMKRNITIWEDKSGRWVVDFSVDLVTEHIWTTSIVIDWNKLIDDWIHRGIVPAHARRVEAA